MNPHNPWDVGFQQLMDRITQITGREPVELMTIPPYTLIHDGAKIRFAEILRALDDLVADIDEYDECDVDD